MMILFRLIPIEGEIGQRFPVRRPGHVDGPEIHDPFPFVVSTMPLEQHFALVR